MQFAVIGIGAAELLILGLVCLLPLLAAIGLAVWLVLRGGSGGNLALPPCPDCGWRVSPQAVACPNCGRPFPGKPQGP